MNNHHFILFHIFILYSHKTQFDTNSNLKPQQVIDYLRGGAPISGDPGPKSSFRGSNGDLVHFVRPPAHTPPKLFHCSNGNVLHAVFKSPLLQWEPGPKSDLDLFFPL